MTDTEEFLALISLEKGYFEEYQKVFWTCNSKLLQDIQTYPHFFKSVVAIPGHISVSDLTSPSHLILHQPRRMGIKSMHKKKIKNCLGVYEVTLKTEAK